MPVNSIELDHNDNGLIEVFFSRDVRDRLEDAFSQSVDLSLNVDHQIELAQHVLHCAVGFEGSQVLSRLGASTAGEGAVLFHIPHDRGVHFSPPPGKAANQAKSTGIVERMMLALSSQFGFAYAVKAEDPEVIGHLIPRLEAYSDFTGEGSQQELSFHSENSVWRHALPGFDLAPRALLLAGVCEQQVRGPTTPIAIVARAVKLMDPAMANRLRRPCAHLSLPFRHRREGSAKRIGPVPILLGSLGREELCAALYPGMIEFDEVADEIALSELAAALREVAIPLRIVPGVCAAIMNGAIVHSRSSFEPVIDAQGRAERWVERLFTHARPESLLHFANRERVFDLRLPI
jgi:hypothetical protein